ncbi:predicted protein [Naegleria gruberi]|uniref:Predicted protein n=1 Tax=Naegleria gruberi TaxID=5762 RepID=D2VWX7_NAEGR|nr:uncharacterized protein NAEGRDRAFT_81524 [Naegleria gruberi]EFC38704.1 predicted protein [Naegleria gruberi]|eukprot:XP_002671448.1 predicted protein [Naegleria gruberi strain NEG-M]
MWKTLQKRGIISSIVANNSSGSTSTTNIHSKSRLMINSSSSSLSNSLITNNKKRSFVQPVNKLFTSNQQQELIDINNKNNNLSSSSLSTIQQTRKFSTINNSTNNSTTTASSKQIIEENSNIIINLLRKLGKGIFYLSFGILGALISAFLLMKGCLELFTRFKLDDPEDALFYNEALIKFMYNLENLDRFVRAFFTLFVIAGDYFLLLDTSWKNPKYWFGAPFPDKNSDEFKQLKKAHHYMNAVRLKNLFMSFKGIYIKYGQFFASLGGWIPDEYCTVMAAMRDQAPTVGYDEVRKVIHQDFGKPLEELFIEFEKEPIASASIAQVHRARTKDGTLVAVKIQYPYVRRFFFNDMETNDIANKFSINVYYLQDDAENIDALVALNNKFNEELKDGLYTELNFLHEANNATKAAANMKKRKDIYIPKVYSDLTSSRVLTMEFIENAVKADNVEAIRKMGFSESDISKRILKSFSEQIMVHGLFHCDPHPSNILVRQNPKNPSEPQIVILDHGLYKEIDDDFRRNYANFWMSIILGDTKHMERYCNQLGISDYKLYASIIMMQGFDSLVSTQNEKQLTEKDWEEFFTAMQVQRDDFVNIYKNMPDNMVFILRTDNILRALNRDLGAKVNRFSIMARAAAKGCSIRSDDGNMSRLRRITQRISSLSSRAYFEMRLFWLTYVKSSLLALYVSLFGIYAEWKRNTTIERNLYILETSKHISAGFE